MSIDINVHVTFDSGFINAMSDIAACMAAISITHSNNTEARLPEKTVTAPEPPAEVPAKAEPKDTKAKEKAPQSEPVSPKKAENEADNAPTGKPLTAKEEKAVNDILSVPAPSDAKPGEDEAAKREEMKKIFTKAAVEGKAAQCKALLKELGVTRQSQIPAEKLDDALEKVRAL
jgi:hypothetical protein